MGVVLFWLFLVHFIIITQMLFFLFCHWGGVLLSDSLSVWMSNGWVSGVISEVLFFFSRPMGVGLLFLFLVHLIIITQTLFSLFIRWGGVLLSDSVIVYMSNGWVSGVVLEDPFFFFFFFLSGPVGVDLFWLFLVLLIIINQMLFSLFCHWG